MRAYLGYDRYDTVAQTLAINLLYDKMWLYDNLFQPVMQLSGKNWEQSDGHPPHLRRRYDQARTPFDRLCQSEAISPSQRQRLETLRDQTNPRQRRQEIYNWIDTISSLPGAAPHTTEDVRLTLMPAASSLDGHDRLPSPLVAGSSQMSERRTTRPVPLSFDLTRAWAWAQGWLGQPAGLSVAGG